jgi:DNA-directed RNA polymerase specialized sigma24 family protein
MEQPDKTPEAGPPGRGHEGGGGNFHTTHWSAVSLAGEDTSPESLAALESLCRTYWYPLYAYCCRQGHSPADGEDLTQQFFAAFLERNSFAAATPERGRFRSFLLASFKNFLANEHHRRVSVKRGGRFAFVSLDDTELETRFKNGPADRTTPEQQYDHAWAMTLLGKVASDLKAEYDTAGKSGIFAALQTCLTGAGSDAGYQAIGASLGMSESAVKMAALRLRQRYGQLLRREIARSLNDPSGVEDELRHLLEAITRK